jgi:hypothetical protein
LRIQKSTLCCREPGSRRYTLLTVSDSEIENKVPELQEYFTHVAAAADDD